MRTLHALIFSLSLLLALCGAANAAPTEESVRFSDSQGFVLDGSNSAVSFGAIMLSSGNGVWILAKNYSGPRSGRVDWQQINLTVYNKLCEVVTPTFISIVPYLDDTTLTFCGNYPTCSNASGSYRPLGNGDQAANLGGGVRAGAMLRDSVGKQYALAVKTSNTKANLGGCGSNPGNDYGPGSVGTFIWIEVRANE